jgi:hypothetical protein
VVSKAAFYRDRAAECALRAAEATAPDIKKSYEDLEAQWLRLAEHHERAERSRPTAPSTQPEPE